MPTTVYCLNQFSLFKIPFTEPVTSSPSTAKDHIMMQQKKIDTAAMKIYILALQQKFIVIC